MMLPNAKRAVVDSEKVRDYFLNPVDFSLRGLTGEAMIRSS
jgi:hypothetical protein